METPSQIRHAQLYRLTSICHASDLHEEYWQEITILINYIWNKFREPSSKFMINV